MTFVDALNLVQTGIEQDVLGTTATGAVLIYREAGEDCPEGWYAEPVDDVARELMDDEEGQSLLIEALSKRGFRFGASLKMRSSPPWTNSLTRRKGKMKDLNKLYKENTLYYWCNATGDLNIPGYPLLACPTADKLPPDVREVYEKYWGESGWENRYAVTCEGKTGLLLNYLFDHGWIKEMIEEKGIRPLSDEEMSKLLHIAVDATVAIVEDHIRSKTEKRFEILVGHDTDPDGDELGVFFPLSELENNPFANMEDKQTKEFPDLVYSTVESNFFRALRGEPASGYDVVLNYGYVNSHDSYDTYHSFELEDPEGAHDEHMDARLAELLDTTVDDEDFRWKSMAVKLPESLVERIQEDAVWGKLRKEKDPVKAYGLYKLWWMLENGHTLYDVAEELREMRYEDPEDSDRIATPDTALFDEWETEKGFGGEVFPSYEAFLEKWGENRN